MRFHIGVITLASILFAIPSETIAQSDLMKKYSGAYGISPDGLEAYALRSDGTCTWVFGWKERGEVKTQRKSGSWSAKEGYLSIAINGNAGLIVEEYILKNGKFVNKENPSRYLIPKK